MVVFVCAASGPVGHAIVCTVDHVDACKPANVKRQQYEWALEGSSCSKKLQDGSHASGMLAAFASMTGLANWGTAWPMQGSRKRRTTPPLLLASISQAAGQSGAPLQKGANTAIASPSAQSAASAASQQPQHLTPQAQLQPGPPPPQQQQQDAAQDGDAWVPAARRGNVARRAGMGLEDDEDSEDSEDVQSTDPMEVDDAHLSKKESVIMFCSSCHHGVDEGQAVGEAVECAACHRVYHCKCYEERVAPSEGLQLPTVESYLAGEPWFHTHSCHKVHNALQRQAAAGEQTISPPSSSGGGASGSQGSGQLAAAGAAAAAEDAAGAAGTPPRRSWRLIYCPAPTMSGRVAMGHVHRVLRQTFGYSMRDYKEFDYAVLLRAGGLPASAALLDVYGADVAELFLLATDQQLRNQGHARALVDQLSRTLASAGVQRLVVSVDDDDQDSAALWGHMGFVPLERTLHRRLGWSIPYFTRDATAGTTYFAHDLSSGRGPSSSSSSSK